MSVTAEMVKELRQRTGAGMMDCKKALVEVRGEIEKAVQLLREKGSASAEKKAGRITADGKIAQHISADSKYGLLAEINCETDFVARDSSFVAFSTEVADYISANRPDSLGSLLDGVLNSGETIEAAKNSLISVIGENISVRRFESIETASGLVYGYLHGQKIGVLVSVVGGSAELGRDLAMHIAASNPIAIDESQIPTKELEREKDIFSTQAAESGKPDTVVDKIVAGKLKKYINENTLLGQKFIKDAEIAVETLLARHNAQVESFVRYELGEGLEKRNEDFVGEVLAQAAGN